MFIDESLWQQLKADLPIIEKPGGMFNDFRLSHSQYLLLVDYQYYTF